MRFYRYKKYFIRPSVNEGVTEPRTVLLHRLSVSSLSSAVSREDVSNVDAFLDQHRKDAHRHLYGWCRGLDEMEFNVRLVDRPTYVLPWFLFRLSPGLYVKLLGIVAHRFSPFRVVDTVLSYFHLLYLIVFFRPKYLIFLIDALPRSLGWACSRLGVTTITDFGDVPSSKPERVKRQVLEYEIITAGFELPRLWPATKEKFHRIFSGPSRDNKFPTERSDGESVDVCVIGGFGGIFERRTSIVSDLLKRLEGEDLTVRVYGYQNGRGLGSRVLDVFRRYLDLDNIEVSFNGYSYTRPLAEEYPRVADSLQGPVYGEDFYDAFAESKIILTIPNDPQIEIGSIRPMGIFEPAAAQTLQIALDNPDTRNTFEPDEEIATFEDGEDLYEQIRQYLRNPNERERISSNAYERFLTEYTAETQIQSLIGEISDADE